MSKFIRTFITPDRAVRKLAEAMVGGRLKAGSTAEDIFYYLVSANTYSDTNASILLG